MTALLWQGALAMGALARQIGREVKRVHSGVQMLTELGLVERDDAVGLLEP